MTETEKLTRAVLALEQRFKKAETAKPQGILSQIITGKRQEATAKLSEMFSAKGAAGMIGLNPNSILGRVLEARHEKKEEKRQEATKAREFASGFTKYTEKGRALSAIDQKKALTQGVALYQKNKALTAGIEEIEARKEEAKKLGAGAGITKQEEQKLQELKFQKENLFNEKKKRERKYKAPRVPVPESTPTPEPEPLSMKESFFEGVAEGAAEELLKINQEQLATLKKIEANSIVSEEDRLEAKKQTEAAKPVEARREQKETNKGMLDSLLDLKGMFKNLIPGFSSLKNILPIVARLATIAGPALAVAGAGAAGFMLGEKVVNPALDWAAQKLTGDKSATFGTGLADANDKIKSLYGRSLDQKIVAAETQERLKLGLSKITKGEPISESMAEFLKSSESSIMSESQRTIYKNNIDRIVIAKAISKPPETTREAQVTEMDRAAQESARIEKEKAEAAKAAPASTVVSSNQNITNISKTTKISPPVRNSEPSFLDGLNHQFA